MAKKIRDEHGNVYVQKKSFYKRIWFIVLVGLFAIGLIKNLTSSSGGQSSTEQVSTSSIRYKTYQLSEVAISINESWKSKEGDTSDTLYFYPDDSSLAMAYWLPLEESVKDATVRSQYLKGMEQSGKVIPANESSAKIDGMDSFLYDATGTIDGEAYKGQLFLVDTPTGILNVIYMSKDDYSSTRKQEFEQILNSVNISDEVVESSSKTTETPTSSESTATVSEFNPTDSSDATIESIKTYSDYMKMYEFIVNEYITNYENMVSQYGLGDATMYQSVRDTVSQSVEQQKKQYGPLGNAAIVGRAEIITFLKEYRDGLQQQIEQMSAALGG
ncbi:hypothetical protein [Streptococcus suis]|uniref:hypothetical protein n=1 Tax=Streptococcus suis TaxID=1307 RepID=UPI001EE6981D|nr:hypothetical protein [Streptococcus suis]MCQ9276482.1 hypothetical protein [Streptococcus suis]